MKHKILFYLMPVMLIPGTVNAAEIYNKDGNKLDIYGKIAGLHYVSKDKNADGDQSYVRSGFKGETQINNQITGYGQWGIQHSGKQHRECQQSIMDSSGFRRPELW